jgi:HD-like signal output (HDOD) protein
MSMVKKRKNRFNYILVGIVAVFIVFLIIGGGFYYAGLRDASVGKTTEYLSALAADRARGIGGWFAVVEKKASAVEWFERTDNTKNGRNEKREEEAFTAWFKTTAADFHAESAAIYDSRRQLLLKEDIAQINIPDELILGSSPVKKGVIFGEVSFIMDRFYTTAVIPLYGREGNMHPAGYLSLNINLSENLFQTIKPLPGNYKSEEILIMPGGHDVYTLLIELKEKKIIMPDLSDQNKDAPRSIFSLFEEDKNPATGLDQKGAEVKACIAGVKGLNWFVITKADISEIEEPLKAEKKKIVLFISAVSVIFILTAFFLIKPGRKTKPKAKDENETGPDTAEEIPAVQNEVKEIINESSEPLQATEPTVESLDDAVTVPEINEVTSEVETQEVKREPEVMPEIPAEDFPRPGKVEINVETAAAITEIGTINEVTTETEEKGNPVDEEEVPPELEAAAAVPEPVLPEEDTSELKAEENDVPVELDAPAEEKEILPHAEFTPDETIFTQEVEFVEEKLQTSTEMEIKEEVIAGNDEEPVEMDTPVEEKEIVPEAEPGTEIAVNTFPHPGEVDITLEAEEVLPETAGTDCDILIEPVKTEIPVEEPEMLPTAAVEEETAPDTIPLPLKAEAVVGPAQELPEENIVETANIEEPVETETRGEEKETLPGAEPEKGTEDIRNFEKIEAVDENAYAGYGEKVEPLPDVELVEGSLNDFMREVKVTEYKKPGKEILARLEEIKSFGLIPKILFEINLLLKNEPDNMQKLAGAIIKEQGITTKLLSVANSPYYGLKKKASSVEYALMLLGREEVCRLVTALSLSAAVRFPSTPHLKYLDYWFHSMVVGFTARDLAQKLGFVPLLNEVFLGGIFHDLGIQILAKHFPKEFGEIAQKIKEGAYAIDAEIEVLDSTHQEIGRYAAEKWGLPADIYDALSCHHNPMIAEGNKILAGIINLADWMVHQVLPEESFWEKGIDLESGNYKILGFKSIEARNGFLEEYYPTLTATMQSIQF